MKKSIVKIFLLALFSLLLINHANSQATLNADDIKAQLVKDWQRAKDYTNEYLNAMPANKYSFKAVDSIRSFAQQMLHLAQANVFFLNSATGSSKYLAGSNLEKSMSAQSKDSVVYYVNSSYDFCIDAINKLDASKLGEKTTFNKMEVSRLTLILKAFEHQTHHRGQTTIYIRLVGIRPPGERLF